MPHCIHISEDVLYQEVAGETVLLDLASESYFGLDEVGTRVWQMLQQGTEWEVMIGRLIADYDVEREVLERDVNTLLGQLEASGLIRRG